MQNTIWYVVGVAVVVGLGIFAYMSMGAAPKATEPAAEQTQATTLRELAAAQSPQRCTFSSASSTTGTVFVAGGKVRGDFSSQIDGKAVMGHMIVADNTSYVWMDGMSQGFKNSFEAHSTSSGQTTTQQGMNPDERVSYSCEPWTPDEGLFGLPSDVTFTAIGSASVQSGAGAVGASCGQCDLIPDAGAKAQCRAALHCQ